MTAVGISPCAHVLACCACASVSPLKSTCLALTASVSDITACQIGPYLQLQQCVACRQIAAGRTTLW